MIVNCTTKLLIKNISKEMFFCVNSNLLDRSSFVFFGITEYMMINDDFSDCRQNREAGLS